MGDLENGTRLFASIGDININNARKSTLIIGVNGEGDEMSKKMKLTILQVSVVMDSAYDCFLDLIDVFPNLEDLKAAIETLQVSNDYLLAEHQDEEKKYQDLRSCGLSEKNYLKLAELIEKWGK